MPPKITIIYANREKDQDRIRISLESLRRQEKHNFQVIFVDYGSSKELVQAYQRIFQEYPFADLHALDVSQVLWNKSKALNYGILNADTPYIFIADVDLVFHSMATSHFEDMCTPEAFYLFSLGYLSKEQSKELHDQSQFDDLKADRFGNVNGMILASRNAFQDIDGFDEFFHFYGAEDVDLFDRMEANGLKRKKCDRDLFYHQWHKSFSGSEDELITEKPRLKNIMRINERHYLRNKKRGIIRPKSQHRMGTIIDPARAARLAKPDYSMQILNIKAHVEHFLEEELKSIKGVVKANFTLDPFYGSNKYSLKKVMGKQTQIYLTLKEVNDLILKKILFQYRDANYSFKIASDLKSIEFRIELE
ncbi:glycosyltransferase [Gramella sp. GC03-9]|uniref:Glycosyltransferase n=1 Tax=Christiangramia oceanisediminis TaxID=2920386 RepID=A0A9X2I5M1_9FLAO|nr:glycosyltransferase [Gramella oceanisediminis]MCP9198309.1 glycosyltransferase [Gramella oceanisediminis]